MHPGVFEQSYMYVCIVLASYVHNERVYICICICSPQLSMCCLEKRYRSNFMIDFLLSMRKPVGHLIPMLREV